MTVRPAPLPPVVLVHGGFLGGWLFDQAIPEFTAIGIDVSAPTLKGLGERADEATETLDVSAQAVDLADDIDAMGQPVVLVGHSYAGMVVTKVADIAPDLIAGLVILDGFVPSDGEALLDLVDQTAADQIRGQIDATGWEHADARRWAIDDPQLREFVAARLTRQSGGTVTERLRLTGAYGGPRVYISLTDRQKPHFIAIADRLRRDPAWRVHDHPGTHLDMLADPPRFAAELAAILRTEFAAAGPGPRTNLS